ncbi:hypothetical protein MBLNU13_g05164t1 [Cladosporium sp. NU13]
MTTPTSTLQQPVVRDTATTGIGHIVAPHPSVVEASGASDSAPVKDSLSTTDAQAAGESSLASGAVPPNAENTAAPDIKVPSAAPPQGNPQIHISSPDVASDRESTTAIYDITPVIAPRSPVEQEGQHDYHRPKQEQNVLNEPAIREDGEGQREEIAKRNVSQILEHHLSGYERAQIAILVDIEDYRGSRRVCVKCFDGAAKKAKEIDIILSEHGTSLQGFPYVVYGREKTKIFGYKGSDIDSINDRIDMIAESYSGYWTRPFSNTPYWKRDSTMVEVFCGDKRDGNMIGAPIRMAPDRRHEYSVSMWTCGGIIKVNGNDYGLTTAHPFVLSTPDRPQKLSPETSPSESAGVTKDLIVGNGPFGGKDEFFSAEHHPEKYWQAIGKVSHYALAKMRSIPSNNDWLLFELPKDRSMWNDFGNSAESSIHALAVFTARGTLSAHILEGTAFLILGNSPFEVLKIELQEPLRPGDSGSWLMRGSELIGVMVAGSEEEPERPLGYAISAQEVYRSISTSMGGISVRPLTDLENAINANNQTGGSQLDLAVLRARQLFDVDAPVRRIKILSDHHTLSSLAYIQTGNAALTALLMLGFFCAMIQLDFPTTQRSHLTRTPSWSTTKRIGEMLHQKMSQLDEGLAVTHLILALSASLPLSEMPARTRECAKALSVLMKELNISPSPAQPHLQALVESVCNRHNLPKALDVHYGGPKEATSSTALAGSLARALYAIRTENFFVHEGVTAKYLRKFLLAYTRYPVIAVGEKDFAEDLSSSWMKLEAVPRIFVAKPDRLYNPQKSDSSGSYYGHVVEFDELDNVLKRSMMYWKPQRDNVVKLVDTRRHIEKRNEHGPNMASTAEKQNRELKEGASRDHGVLHWVHGIRRVQSI